jgi:HEAT repeat protein
VNPSPPTPGGEPEIDWPEIDWPEIEWEDPAVGRAAAVAAAGHQGRLGAGVADELEAASHSDTDGRVRAAALGALVQRGDVRRAARVWLARVTDPDPTVRRRAANLAPSLAARREPALLATPLVELLADPEVTVVEAAAWALGELGAVAVTAGAVGVLSTTTTEHTDPLAREAAVAALGALGDAAALPAVLAACRDKPAVRRRAVLALAPFDGPEVDAALAVAADDRDWQVRESAEVVRGSGQ